MSAPLKHSRPDLLGQRSEAPEWFSMIRAGDGLLGEVWILQPAEDADEPDTEPEDTGE